MTNGETVYLLVLNSGPKPADPSGYTRQLLQALLPGRDKNIKTDVLWNTGKFNKELALTTTIMNCVVAGDPDNYQVELHSFGDSQGAGGTIVQVLKKNA